MALKIKPVRLNKSIYVRVPNDIADLIGINGEADVTLKFQDAGEEFFLIYVVHKVTPGPDSQLPVPYANRGLPQVSHE
jgi:hypothetical protein